MEMLIISEPHRYGASKTKLKLVIVDALTSFQVCFSRSEEYAVSYLPACCGKGGRKGLSITLQSRLQA